ncbi:MAG TPA: lysine exporter LysO family protein [Spirochaetales bacterium]|nr:lysine exporter LysO family protein [Spirochaetales bacterium]HRY53601.1 lysine exporter LysO family protein [Spirochaetia bacterium]
MIGGILQILSLGGFLAAGALLPRLRLAGRSFAPGARAVDLFIKLVLRALLLAMGFRLGNDPELAPRLAAMGELAVAAALLAVAGSLAAIVLAYALFAPSSLTRAPRAGGPEAGSRPGPGRFAEPASLLAFVAAGFALGLLLPRLEAFDLSAATAWALDALLFCIGMQFSRSASSLRRAFLEPATLLVPLATAAGSLGAGLALVPLFGLAPGKALALVGGFGWYSLSGVLISDLGDPALGSAAFLANLVRESIAFASIPFLARSRLPGLAIGVGGATAMDVTLPLIEQSAGPEIVPASFASGAILSLAVPILVPLLYRL